LDGGWGWRRREKSLRAGPTHARCARPGARIMRSACGRDPPIYKKK